MPDEGDDSLVVMATVVLDTAEVIPGFCAGRERLVPVVVLYGGHHDADVGRVDPVLVKGHGMEQGVTGPQFPRPRFCGVDGPDEGQGAVGTGLDDGFGGIQPGPYQTVFTASQQQKGDETKDDAMHKRWFVNKSTNSFDCFQRPTTECRFTGGLH